MLKWVACDSYTEADRQAVRILRAALLRLCSRFTDASSWIVCCQRFPCGFTVILILPSEKAELAAIRRAGASRALAQCCP